ncbi:MAG: hypothetical protein HYY54_04440 [candidate division NC10 bacterium]|nr:hypothetical protein [candidate division NC10 bacterium]
MKRIRNTDGAKRTSRRTWRKVVPVYRSFRSREDSPASGNTILGSLSPELRSLVREIVTRYDEDLRQLARH